MLQLADEVAAAVWRRVAAVHEAVNEDALDFLLLGHFEQREEVLDVRVHAAVAQESDEVQLVLAAALHRLLKERHVLQLFVGDQKIDARDVHVNDSAGADVHVAYFAVAHLAFGQADVGTGRVDERVRIFLQQVVVGGLAREGDGVAFCFGAVAPSVEYGQYDWFRSFGS